MFLHEAFQILMWQKKKNKTFKWLNTVYLKTLKEFLLKINK